MVCIYGMHFVAKRRSGYKMPVPGSSSSSSSKVQGPLWSIVVLDQEVSRLNPSSEEPCLEQNTLTPCTRRTGLYLMNGIT